MAGSRRGEGGGVASVSFTRRLSAGRHPECGPAAIACGEDAAAVAQAADALARAVEAKRIRIRRQALAAGRGGRLTRSSTRPRHSRPIVLADTQDNPGAGANSDTVGMLEALVKQGASDAVFGLLYDPEAAAAAHAAGEGAQLERADRRSLAHARPRAVPGRLHRRGAERRRVRGDRARSTPATRCSWARWRCCAIGGVRVVVSSRKQQAADQAMLRHLGIDPTRQKILALKSSVHFRADFEPIASEVLVVEAPGPNIADPKKLPYRHLRRGLRLGPLGPAFGG